MIVNAVSTAHRSVARMLVRMRLLLVVGERVRMGIAVRRRVHSIHRMLRLLRLVDQLSPLVLAVVLAKLSIRIP